MLSERSVRGTFLVVVWLKAAHAVIEVIGGVLLYLVSTVEITRLVQALTIGELSEDPQDWLANHLVAAAHGFSVSTKAFATLYLFSHGIVNLALSLALLRGKPHAYLASMAALLLFIAYQLYRYSHTHSPALLALTVLDVVLIILSWHEYRRVVRHLPLD